LDESGMKYVKINVPQSLYFAVMIPEFPLATEQARKVVPRNVSLEDSIFNTSRAALLTASMLTGEVDNLSIAMQDRLHQPYREEWIPGMNQIMKKAQELGAKGVFLSGAGPTLIAVVKEVVDFREQMTAFFDSLSEKWSIHMLQADSDGAQIEL
jgi:homoserine kinase